MLEYRYGFEEGQVQLSETSYIQTDTDSINQSNFYSVNIPGIARLSDATARSVFKYKVVEAIP